MLKINEVKMIGVIDDNLLLTQVRKNNNTIYNTDLITYELHLLNMFTSLRSK